MKGLRHKPGIRRQQHGLGKAVSPALSRKAFQFRQRGGIVRGLGADSPGQVDVQRIGQLQAVHGHVRHFLGGFGQLPGRERLLPGFPGLAEDLQ